MDSQKQIQVKNNLLIELDAILDTRKGTVAKLYPEVAEDLLYNVGYRKRLSDQLHLIDPRIDEKEYVFAYLKRDIETLDHSKASMITSYVNQLIRKIQMIIDGNNPYIKEVNVVVNYYPYKLSEEEQHLICSGVSSVMNLDRPVDMVYLEPKEITLDFLRESNIFTYVLYDFDLWSTVALPDVNGENLKEVGLSKIENLTIIAARIAKDAIKAREVEEMLRNMQLPVMMQDISTIPWSLLFDLELIDPIFFTEYNHDIAEKIMNALAQSNNPIDIEVELVSNYYHLLTMSRSTREHVDAILDRMNVVSFKLTQHFNNADVDVVRKLLAEQRFLTDALTHFSATKPSEDFERYFDSKMSAFDTSLEFSEVSEKHWNDQDVKCKRYVRNVVGTSTEVFILTVAEDCHDKNGKRWFAGEVLPSVNYFEPILEPLPENVIAEYHDRFKD